MGKEGGRLPGLSLEGRGRSSGSSQARPRQAAGTVWGRQGDREGSAVCRGLRSNTKPTGSRSAFAIISCQAQAMPEIKYSSP